MLTALIGIWLGATTLTLKADGSYTARHTLSHGTWQVHGSEIVFIPFDKPVIPGKPIKPLAYASYHCGYKLHKSALTLSDCPYRGNYVLKK